MGMSFEDLLDYFGRKRKKYIRRVILEESLEPENGPGIISNSRTTKLKIEQKNYIDQLIDDENYLGGLRDTTERLRYHSNPKIQVSVSEKTVRKYLNREYVMKNLDNQYKTPTFKLQTLFATNKYKEKKIQAKKIAILLKHKFVWISFDQFFMVNFFAPFI